MIHSHSTGGVVVNELGKVIVVNQRGVSWSLPKGHIEHGEDEIETAKREIYEETGIKELELVRQLGNYERHRIGKDGKEDDQTELKLIDIYLFKAKDQELKPIDPDNPEARWVAIDEVAELLTHPKDKEFFLGVMAEVKASTQK